MHISKRFGPLQALDGVSVEFAAGAVHGVLGENGAGKSTLMRVAAGLLTPDSGRILLDSHELRPGSPVAAERAGIAMVHQHFMLAPRLTVAENFVIGRRELGQVVSRREVGRRIIELGRRLRFEIDPAARVETLSVGQRQRVEILRALSIPRKVLILDEPTAVLTPPEVEPLLEAMDHLRREGLAVVFITHKLGEVERICDRVTILRRGRHVHTADTRELTPARMAELMVGRAVEALPERTPATTGETVLEMRGVSVNGRDSGRRIDNVHLSVAGGEILGIAGVEGNGQDLLAAALVGTARPREGVILLDGQDITPLGVRARDRAGLVHIAEDRLGQALVPEMTLSENLILKDYDSPRFSRLGLLRGRAIRSHAQRLLAEFDVRADSPAVAAGRLSGGNQQKVVLARELSGAPRCVVAHNPTRGLDVAATSFVFGRLLAQRARGAAILLIHSDLDELLGLADRVAVMFRGRCIPTGWPNCPRDQIGRLMLVGEP